MYALYYSVPDDEYIYVSTLDTDTLTELNNNPHYLFVEMRENYD